MSIKERIKAQRSSRLKISQQIYFPIKLKSLNKDKTFLIYKTFFMSQSLLLGTYFFFKMDGWITLANSMHKNLPLIRCSHLRKCSKKFILIVYSYFPLKCIIVLVGWSILSPCSMRLRHYAFKITIQLIPSSDSSKLIRALCSRTYTYGGGKHI